MNTLKKDILTIKKRFQTELKNAQNQQQLDTIRIEFLGRKGAVASFMAQLKKLSLEEKKEIGPLLQELRTFMQEAYEQAVQSMTTQTFKHEFEKEKSFDVTAYLPHQQRGSLHIYTQTVQEIENILISMGFERADGPEIETDYYNFEALNIPEDHPARDMHDTFWLTIPHMLLRTHTSTVQIHAMEQGKTTLAIFAPGRAYRNEETDASHDFMFTQLEALLIDKNISMANLLAIAKTFLQKIFNKQDLEIRVRPGYFPFVEPGVEIDAQCPFCTQGCSVCKKTRWIELLGAGLVHPNVLKYGGIDTDIYSGFAFGLGIERLAMIKHGITDIRLFHQNKESFLKQF